MWQRNKTWQGTSKCFITRWEKHIEEFSIWREESVAVDTRFNLKRRGSLLNPSQSTSFSKQEITHTPQTFQQGEMSSVHHMIEFFCFPRLKDSFSGCTRRSRTRNTFICWWKFPSAENCGPSSEIEVGIFLVQAIMQRRKNVQIVQIYFCQSFWAGANLRLFNAKFGCFDANFRWLKLFSGYSKLFLVLIFPGKKWYSANICVFCMSVNVIMLVWENEIEYEREWDCYTTGWTEWTREGTIWGEKWTMKS